MCCFMYFMDGPFANPDPEDDGREPLEEDDAFLDQLRGVAHTHEPEYKCWIELQMKVCEDFTITEKAHTRVSSWLKAPTSTFTFKTLL